MVKSIGVALPYLLERSELHGEAIRSLLRAEEETGIKHDILSILNNGETLGYGWNQIAKQFLAETDHDVFLFFCDDMELETWGDKSFEFLEQEISPAAGILNKDGTFQQWGGHSKGSPNIFAGNNALWSIAPCLTRKMLEYIYPFPNLNHYVDIWAADVLRAKGFRHKLCGGFTITHKITTAIDSTEGMNYNRFKTEALRTGRI